MDGTSVGLVGAAISLHLFLLPQHLKYHTQIHVRSRHGKNRGRKISGVEPLPGEDKVERDVCVSVCTCACVSVGREGVSECGRGGGGGGGYRNVALGICLRGTTNTPL